LERDSGGEETDQTKLVLTTLIYFRQTHKNLCSIILQRNPWRRGVIDMA
jgi:hypothetical protein